MSRTRKARGGTRIFRAFMGAALLTGLVVVGAGASQASSPSSGSITVPTAVGQSSTDSWTGTIPLGADALSNCSVFETDPLGTFSDQHITAINVPSGAYNAIQAKFTFNITWNNAANDEILTVLDPDGNEVGSSDTGQPSETVTAFNLKAGNYKIIACAFAATSNQPYTGSAKVETTAIPPPPPPLPTSSNGITFDHANLNDPVRMVGEPDIITDPNLINNNYGIYVSGPGGSTTQASWFWKSTDKGIQWHLIGCSGKSNCQNGGGDTEITIAKNRDVFASDLQTLQCNSTFRSYDQGNTFTPGEGCFPETDRQWMGNYDPNGNATGRRIYLGANHVVNPPGFSGCYMLVSTDNGVTYVSPDTGLPPGPTDTGIDIGGSCIGRQAVDPSNGDVFVPVSGGTRKSSDGGKTWQKLPGPGAVGNFFAPLALDTQGNLWQAWTDTRQVSVSYSQNDGQTWHAPITVNTPGIQQTDFVWLTVGDPGRVAVVFYGTQDTERDPSVPSYGGPKALWHAYASVSTNALAAVPTFTQVQATEHIMHRGPICNGGFPGCLINNSDRSMADFFMVDKDPQGRIFIAYNENGDLSQVTPGQYIGKPINAVIRLRTGPSLFSSGGNEMLPIPTPPLPTINSESLSGSALSLSGTHGLPPGNWSTDPSGDAVFPNNPPVGTSHPSMDIREVTASGNAANLTMKMRVENLSAMAADAATIGGIPSWMVTWWEPRGGIGPNTMDPPYHSHWYMKYKGGNFECGKVSSVDAPALGAPTPKYLTYLSDPTCTTNMTGSVNGNEITLTARLADLGGLQSGVKIDHVAGYTNVEQAQVTLNDWADQAKTFSYVVGTPAPSGTGNTGPFQHMPDGYVEVATNPNFTNAVRAKLFPNNNTWTATLPITAGSGTIYARQVLSKALYTPVWDDVEAGRAQRNYAYAANVTIDKSTVPANQTTAHLGQPVTFQITVRNNGPFVASGLSVVDTFTKSAGYSSAKSITGTWTCSSKAKGTVTCALSGSLAKNASAVLQIVIKPTDKGTMTNTACETASPGDTQDCDTVNLTVP